MARTSRKHVQFLPQVNPPAIKAALYVRLSNEDNGGKGKDSIGNQLGLLQEFAGRLEKAETVEAYIDNGRTGTDFERPEWERLMGEIRERKVNCVIVKDLSRFARNYIEAGDYLEKIFPFLGVRFIAVNDHYDSANELFGEKDLITEFKNLANDYYSKDISKKVMSAFGAKKGRGEFIGSKAPYGYDLADNRFVVDEPAAAVVRRIFGWKLQGVSSYEIARRLNRENVPSPSRHAMEKGLKKYRNSGDVLWQQQAVNRILYDRVYTGDLVQGKYNSSIYSRGTRGKKDEDAWEIVKGVHEAIIDREQFRQVQEIKEKNRKIWRDRQGGPKYGNVLEGILVCGICHCAMRRNKDIRNGKARYYFYCSSAYDHAQAECDTSSIVDYKIFDMVLDQIKLQIDLAVETENLISKMKGSGVIDADYKRKKQELERMKEELGRQVYLRTSIYGDMKQGLLTQEEYLAARERYGRRISGLEKELLQKEGELEELGRCMDGENRWLKAFLRFREAPELTRDMAVELLERVEVYGDKRLAIRFRFRNEYEHLASRLPSKEGRAALGGETTG